MPETPLHDAADPAEVQFMLGLLVSGQTLSEDDAERLFETLLSGGLDDAQIGALLAMLQRRGPTADELTGAARSMRRHATPIPFEAAPDETLIDTCGTGGAPKTFNISTAAALIAAAATPATDVRRVVVAKHGNRSRTGRGSAEILAQLGVNIDASPETQAACLREVGVCFCFAIHHHPAMRYAKGPRTSLGFPTIFNLLGPLTNPAGAKRQLLGVYNARYVPLIGDALARLGAARAMVVHGQDGLDEITTTTSSTTADIAAAHVTPMEIDPKKLGIEPATLDQLRADDLESAGDVIRSVLAGEPGPKTDIALINAAAALLVGDACESLAQGLELARDAVSSGAASRTLADLARVSHAGNS
ncbi:MAG: anthranilate phosphoribosyltransferase [Planctomycetota bacterium]